MEFLIVRATDAGFGGAVVCRQGGEQGRKARFAVGKQAQEPARGIQRIVKAVVLVSKEDMPRHFAGKHGACFAHAGFNQRVACFCEFGSTAKARYFIYKYLRALYLDQAGGVRVLREYLAPEKGHQLIAPDDVTSVVDHADAVAVSVKANAKVGVSLKHLGTQVLEVLCFGGVGFVVREVAVGGEVERDIVDAKGV